MNQSGAQAGDVLDPTRLVQRVADRALELIPGAEGVLIGFSDEDGVTYVCGAGFLLAHVGTRVDLDASLSGLALRRRRVLRSDDTDADPRVDLEATRRLGVRSSVCVPLLRGNETLGVMAVSAKRPGAFTDNDVALLERLADSVSVAVGLASDFARVDADLHGLSLETAPASSLQSASVGPSAISASRFAMSVLRPEALSIMEARQRIDDVLKRPERVMTLFQPIFDIFTNRVVSMEALTRFELSPHRTADLWFSEAHEVGRGIELEMLAIERALGLRAALPDDVDLAINVGPETILTSQFAEVLSDASGEGIVVELTEHSQVKDYECLRSALFALRRGGARLAIDDTGAGFSSLSHILKLAPDFIKLDRELVEGIDIDPVRRALATSLATFARETGSQVIAEGVETQGELETLRRIGIHQAQGFLLGQPALIGSLSKDGLESETWSRRD